MINVKDLTVTKYLKVIKPEGLAVLLAISVHADSTTNRAWPGVPRLQHITGLGRDRVYRAIKNLCKAGILKKDLDRRKGKYVRVNYQVNPNYVQYYVVSPMGFTEQIAGTNQDQEYNPLTTNKEASPKTAVPFTEIQEIEPTISWKPVTGFQGENILYNNIIREIENNKSKKVPEYKIAFLRLCKAFSQPEAYKTLKREVKYRPGSLGELEQDFLECCEHYMRVPDFLQDPVGVAPKYLFKWLRRAQHYRESGRKGGTATKPVTFKRQQYSNL